MLSVELEIFATVTKSVMVFISENVVDSIDKRSRLPIPEMEMLNLDSFRLHLQTKYLWGCKKLVTIFVSCRGPFIYNNIHLQLVYKIYGNCQN